MDVHELRHQVHEEMDEMWRHKSSHMRVQMRAGCYRWLRRHLGISQKECHIGQLSREQCIKSLEVIRMAKSGLIEMPRPSTGYQKFHLKKYGKRRLKRIKRGKHGAKRRKG